MASFLMNRRTLITRGCSGVATLAMSSLFGTLVREAHGAEAPKRLVIYMSGSGIDQKLYNENKVSSPTSFQFANGFAPLQRIQKDVIFMSPFVNTAHMDQHGNAMAALTCAKDLRARSGYKDPRPGGPSFDFFLAQQSKATEPFPVVPISQRAADNHMHERVASGVDRVVPMIQGAKAAYARLFGALRAGGDAALLANRRRLINARLIEDAKKLSSRLAGVEKVRLEEFADSLNEITARYDRWARSDASASCAAPDPARFTADTHQQTITQQVDLVAPILRCGLSRFVTLVCAPGGARMWFPGHTGDGVVYPNTGLDQHDMHHVYLNPDAQASNPDIKDRARGHLAYHAHNVARIWEQLKAIREGNGSMADRTIILWFSDGGGSHHNGWRNQPAIIVGGAGKMKTGRYLEFPARVHSIAQVFVTVAHALDIPVKTFGDGTDRPSNLTEDRPLPGLLTI